MSEIFTPRNQKTIFHLDMNAYFASVEEASNPFIRGKAVAVVGSKNYANSAILARSYAAKARGVKSFSRLREARATCPELITVPMDHLKYYDINNRLYEILLSYTPLIEIYSIDEFFLDMTNYCKLWNAEPEKVANEMKARIKKGINPSLTCSIGISVNKLLAKVGSDFKKPDGLTVIPWEERLTYLDQLELEDIWGIGWNSTPKLKKIGLTSTKHIRAASVNQLRDLVGGYWTRLKLIANGEWDSTVNPLKKTKPAQSMQHAHTLSQATSNPTRITMLLKKLAERLARRLRKHGQAAGEITIGLRLAREQNYGWNSHGSLYNTQKVALPTNNGQSIFEVTETLFWSLYPKLGNQEVRLALVSLSQLVQVEQLNMLTESNEFTQKIDKAIDKINDKYGEFTVRTADLLHERSKERELSTPRQNMTFHPD